MSDHVEDIAPISKTAPRYSIANFSDILKIPDEALPRFYDELPRIVESLKTAQESFDDICESSYFAFCQRHPILKYFIRYDMHKELMRKQLEKLPRLIWVDDKDRKIKCGEISMRTDKNADPFFVARREST